MGRGEGRGGMATLRGLGPRGLHLGGFGETDAPGVQELVQGPSS